MRQRGFSLLEVLVAFSILALSLGVLMRIYSGALNNVGVASEQAEALVVAQSLLAGAGVETPLAEGETAGRHGERFDWRLVVAPVETERQAARAGAGGVRLWEVSARVAWRASPGAVERAVTLTTLRAQVEVAP